MRPGPARSFIASGCALVGAFGLAVLPALPAAEARTSSTPPVIRLVGHGNGHGHGLSQYGAQGAALKGLTAQQIVAFYYPGTAGATSNTMVRVLISADTDHNVIVGPASALKLTDLGSHTAYVLPTTGAPAGSTISAWRLSVVQGATRVAYRTDVWRPYSPGGKVALIGDGEFRSSAGFLTLVMPGGNRQYRGGLRLSAGRTVNVLGLDNYVNGVLPAEVSTSWAPAALQAQAIASRTYAAYERAANLNSPWQLCDTSACQVYVGKSHEAPSTNAASHATAGQILIFKGQPAFTQFSSSSGGQTAAGSVPYLPSQVDPYDGYSGNPVHSWTTTVDDAAVERAYPGLGSLTGLQVLARDGHGQWGGRVTSIRLVGSSKTLTLTGTAFRSLLRLRSTYFTVTP